jgi:hypothetical protein
VVRGRSGKLMDHRIAEDLAIRDARDELRRLLARRASWVRLAWTAAAVVVVAFGLAVAGTTWAACAVATFAATAVIAVLVATGRLAIRTLDRDRIADLRAFLAPYEPFR